MNSEAHGTDTSETEVTNISSHGIWLYTFGEELFLSYEDFPWFKSATIEMVIHVEQVAPGHFYWPELDIDLGIETIRNPEKYPLKSKK